MPARVYEVDRSEAEELKKALSYDPYLDTNLIPPAIKAENVEKDKLTPEQAKEIEERDRKIAEAHKMLGESPKGRFIFSRQDYSLRDGASLGLGDGKSYLYLNATEDFLKGAEERFKNEFKTVKRTSPEDEQKVIRIIKEEEEKANAGFGSIFGN
ncbi:MAG: hypothetical protein KGI06_01915 [Candidatus Micrarchaeota archaeon]|nr:hypothetical protein [Candidatus Micrarchaeota archaeon]